MGEYGPPLDKELEATNVTWVVAPLGFFRKIVILQLVKLVLTYDFSRCDFKNFTQEYDNVIYPELEKYTAQAKSTKPIHHKFCKNQRWECLAEIVNRTFNPKPGCQSLAEETFARATNASLSLRCPDFSVNQINNDQRMKREVKETRCLEEILYLKQLWHRFSRILEKLNKTYVTATK
ncbi:PREDICTED: thymic stromal lymphopoietin [Elephantulus edwardii]|uniref:thymic stromal lymphopoietin n=1 Tax=Elephantulus edwardii TaxID=28737 RepID=UPI0003F0CEC9|nr:PREDICTED: thymic stromal lymphopoietin [Elephantulus edwardii]